jgi:hypothetical protein
MFLPSGSANPESLPRSARERAVKTGGSENFLNLCRPMKRMNLPDYRRRHHLGFACRSRSKESACFRVGTRIAQPSVFEEVRMSYETIPILIFLMIPLLSGLGLIGDALRRAIQDMQRADHNLHPQPGPKLI